MSSFEQASYLTQVRRLREMAIVVVRQYPIKVRSVEFIKYSSNAIFKITDCSDKKYILRISPAHFHTKNAMLEEFEWLNSILKSTKLSVPKPVHNHAGEDIVEHQHPGISEIRYCALFEWIEGRHFWKAINEKYAYHVGALTAQLEKSGQGIKSKHRIYWNAEGLVGTTQPRYTNLEQLTGVPHEQNEIIKMARRCAYAKLKEYEHRHPEKLGLIHEDLNPNNIIIMKGRYSVIDFDDCGVGFYGYDLAAPLFAFEYLTEDEKKKDFSSLKEALYQGYADYIPLTQEDIDMIPYFLLVRKLNAISALELRKSNPKMRPWFLKAVERAALFFKLNKME
jgi:Ser/Thr protein kinase RdoA (MazF antagonist)